MTRVLVATNSPYWNRSKGVHQRIHSLISYLVGVGLDVSVYFSGSAAVDPSGTVVPVYITQDIIPGSAILHRMLLRMVGWIKEISAAFTSPRRKKRRRDGYRTWHDLVSEPERAAFLKLVNQLRPHVIIVEYIWLTRLIIGLPTDLRRSTLLVLDTHDVMHERTRAFLERNRPLSFGANEDDEADSLRHFDIVLAIQAHDAEKFSALCPDVEVLTVLHGIEATPVAEPKTRVAHVLYVGANTEPNIAGLREFINSVWAIVVSQCNDVIFDVVGSVCDSFSGFESQDSINFHGVVEDLEPFYRRATIVVAPVTFGSGLKIKVVEALAYGKPMVTTPVGGEGLESGAGSAFLVADNAGTFAATCVRLLGSAAERSRLATAATAFATRTFSPKAVFGELETRIARAAKAPCLEAAAK